GVAVRPVAFSLAVEMVAAALAGAAVSLVVLGWWGLAATVCLVGALGGAKAVGLTDRFTRRQLHRPLPATVHAASLYIGVWACLGLSYWVTARALFSVPFSEVLTYAGVFSLAWLAGFAAIYAPGGIGVREAVAVALLRGRLGAADALVLAAASRAILTFV